MDSIDIELKIREVVNLFGKSSKGWEKCIHTGCDHGKKGPRAAFLFGPNSITFNCFNCGSAAILDLSSATSVPKKFRGILEDFGMDKKSIDEIDFQLLSTNNRNSGTSGKTKPKKPKNIIPNKILLPKDFIMLEGNEDTTVGKLAIAELNRRKIDADDYPFMICIKSSTLIRKKWENRLIIPTFYNNDLVFYQAQDLTGKSNAKYLNANDDGINRSKIISNYDTLYEKSEKPIYVVEGWYDAYHIKGVAVFGNQIKTNQISWLNKSYRDKIYIPDRYGDGANIALECLKRGWKISVPYDKLDSSIKDVSDMIRVYGLLFTLKRIKESTSNSEMDGKVKVAYLTK